MKLSSIIKNNTVRIDYRIENHIGIIEFEGMLYQFPLINNDTHRPEKAIYYMQDISHALEDQTFIEYVVPKEYEDFFEEHHKLRETKPYKLGYNVYISPDLAVDLFAILAMQEDVRYTELINDLNEIISGKRESFFPQQYLVATAD